MKIFLRLLLVIGIILIPYLIGVGMDKLVSSYFEIVAEAPFFLCWVIGLVTILSIVLVPIIIYWIIEFILTGDIN